MSWPKNATAISLESRRRRRSHLDKQVKPHLEAALGDGGGCAAVVKSLEQAGIPSPGRKGRWSRTAVWRIAKRLGIPLSTPGFGIGAMGYQQGRRTMPGGDSEEERLHA